MKLVIECLIAASLLCGGVCMGAWSVYGELRQEEDYSAHLEDQMIECTGKLAGVEDTLDTCLVMSREVGICKEKLKTCIGVHK